MLFADFDLEPFPNTLTVTCPLFFLCCCCCGLLLCYLSHQTKAAAEHNGDFAAGFQSLGDTCDITANEKNMETTIVE